VRQVHPVTELGRHDELPQAFIPGGLPLAKTIGDIDATFRSVEAGLGGAALAGTLASDVASVGPPLSRVPFFAYVTLTAQRWL